MCWRTRSSWLTVFAQRWRIVEAAGRRRLGVTRWRNGRVWTAWGENILSPWQLRTTPWGKIAVCARALTLLSVVSSPLSSPQGRLEMHKQRTLQRSSISARMKLHFSPRLPHNRSLQVAAMLTALIQYFFIHQPPNTSFPIRRRDLQDDVWKQLQKQITATNECFLISHKFSYSSGTKRNVVKAEESRWFEVKGRQMFWSVGGKQETNICHDQPPRPSSSADFNNVWLPSWSRFLSHERSLLVLIHLIFNLWQFDTKCFFFFEVLEDSETTKWRIVNKLLVDELADVSRTTSLIYHLYGETLILIDTVVLLCYLHLEGLLHR